MADFGLSIHVYCDSGLTHKGTEYYICPVKKVRGHVGYVNDKFVMDADTTLSHGQHCCENPS